jgi:signal transduction histidine kinase
MMAVSLRVRATAVATLLCLPILVLASWLLVEALDRHLTTGSEELSRSRAQDLLDQARSGELPTVLRNVNDDAVAQVIGADGTVLAASPNIAGKPPIVSPQAADAGRRRTIRAPDDRETETYRVWVQSGPGPQSEVTVVVGSSLEAVHEATATVRRALVVGVPLVDALLAVVVWLVLGGALARLDRIRAEVDAIEPDQLGRRVPGADRRDEVGRLAATMNRMLDRVDGSVQRQRRLVADVSHDLQGPLAAQRVSLELALAARPPAVDVELLRRDVLGATNEMERLVDDLLVLAATDEGAPGTSSPVDLETIVLEEAARARLTGTASVSTRRVSAGPVRGDPTGLRRLVRNLLDNAVTHARSRIDLELVTRDGHVVLDVVDDGPGVPDAERARIFERFHRGDPARTRGTPGTGLGLAIARGLAESAGGSLELVGHGPGARFRLTLPALPPGPPE